MTGREQATPWRWLRCVFGHIGTHEEWEHEECGTLRISTLVRRECLVCGREVKR